MSGPSQLTSQLSSQLSGRSSGQSSGPRSAGDVLEVDTPLGPARVTAAPAVRPRATVVLGHGAGGGIGARDLTALAGALPPRGCSVLLVEQPWRVAGGRVAPAPHRLDVGWVAALEQVRDRRPDWFGGLLVVGGRSAGARVACRTAATTGADAVLALAFPLHPPGRPTVTRADELTGVDVPVLVVQGGRDPFGTVDQFPAGIPVVAIPDADHTFAVQRQARVARSEALELLVAAVVRWVRALPRER